MHHQLCVILTCILTSVSLASEIILVSPADNTVTADTRPSVTPLLSHSGDMSIPLPVRCSWKSTGELLPAGYSFYLSSDSLIDSSDLYRTGIADTFCDVWNLELNRRYYWKVTGAGETAASGRYSFTTASEWPRMIFIEGTTNVRDIGGCRNASGTLIRQGLLYRSAEFNQTKKITENGLEQLRALGIVTEIDLKMNQENPQQVIPWLPRYIRPLSDSGDGMALYLEGLTKTPEVVAAVFREMALPQNYPMIIHCRMGADRTGEIFAMAEALLGCSEEQITLDYIWSSLSTFGMRDTASLYWKDFVAFLRSLDPEGGTLKEGSRNFLLSIGVTAEELAALPDILLDTITSHSSIWRIHPERADACVHTPKLHGTELIIQMPYLRESPGAAAVVFDLSGRVRRNKISTRFSMAPGLYIMSIERRNMSPE